MIVSKFSAAPSQLNVSIKIIIEDEDAPFDEVLKSFKRLVNQSGHLQELRHRDHWETAADKKKRKAERLRVVKRIERTNDKYARRSSSGYEYSTS
jgi:small subunit ribosomal protein S21